MNLRQAAQRALKAMEDGEDRADMIEFSEALIALRAALAEPEQEPVACPYCKNSATLGAVYYDQNCVGCVKRMTSPPQRKPLTDEEIELAYRRIWRDLPSDFDYTTASWIEQGIRYAEIAHGIKEQA